MQFTGSTGCNAVFGLLQAGGTSVEILRNGETCMQNSRTTSTDLHQLLRKRILTLDLAPGTKLSENSLCDEYQEGRPRVRDVLARLGVEGCVMVLPQSGTFVTLLLQSNIRQIARARTLIGQRIIREVCDKGLSETQMAELQRITAEVNASRDEEEYLLHYEDYCRFLERCCGRHGVWKFLGSVDCDFSRAQRLVYRTYSTGREMSILEHQGVETRMLTEYILKRDADAGGLILESHYNQILIHSSMAKSIFPGYFGEEGTAV